MIELVVATKRIQVLVEDEEREAFRRHAREERLSLSAWLREAGRQRLARERRRREIETLEQLEAFFRECDEREGQPGDEPDWTEHLHVIDRSRGSGRADG